MINLYIKPNNVKDYPFFMMNGPFKAKHILILMTNIYISVD